MGVKGMHYSGFEIKEWLSWQLWEKTVDLRNG
jgi:hypothetical protein